MRTIVAIGIAGALGALARYGLDGVVSRRLRTSFPWGTFVVNISGALVLGQPPHHPHDRATHDLTVAALGADDRLPRRVHDLLDAPVRDVPPARGWRRRPRRRQRLRQRGRRPLRRLPRSRRREGSVTSL